jgi:hypothetical protein
MFAVKREHTALIGRGADGLRINLALLTKIQNGRKATGNSEGY